MSTFTNCNCNQSCGTDNLPAFTRKLEDLGKKLDELTAKYSSLNEALKSNNNKISEQIKSKEGTFDLLTVLEKLVLKNETTIDVSNITSKDLEIIGKSSIKDLDAENIFIGSQLQFDKFDNAKQVCSQNFLIAKLSKLPEKETGSNGTTYKPAMLFLSSPQNDKMYIFATISYNSLTALYSIGSNNCQLELHELNNEVYIRLHFNSSPSNRTFSISYINCEPVDKADISGLNKNTSKATLSFKSEGGFATSNGYFDKAIIKKLLAEDSKLDKLVAITAQIDSLTSKQFSADKANIREAKFEGIETKDIVADKVDAEEATIGTTETMELITKHILDTDNVDIVNVDKDSVEIGSDTKQLTLLSKDRPKIIDEFVSIVTDIHNHVSYQGHIRIFTKDLEKIKNLKEYPITKEEKYKLAEGDLCLVIEGNTDQFRLLEYIKVKPDEYSWIYRNLDLKTNKYSKKIFFWIADLCLFTEPFYDEAIIIYDLDKKELFVQRVNFKNVYSKAEVDQKIKWLESLFSVQPNWLEKERQLNIKGKKFDNPAYILNKPITGVSLLCGGNWDEHNSLAIKNQQQLPNFVAIGGCFDDQQTNIGHIATANNIYQNCIIQIMAGKKDSLPSAMEETKNTLKWCLDSGELFADCFNANDDEKKDLQCRLTGNNFLVRSKYELQQVRKFALSKEFEVTVGTEIIKEKRLIKDKNDLIDISQFSKLLFSRRHKDHLETDLALNKNELEANGSIKRKNFTTELTYQGELLDNGKVYPFDFNFKVKEDSRLKIKKHVYDDANKHDDKGHDSNAEYFKKLPDIELDLDTKDIEDFLDNNDKRIAQLEDLRTSTETKQTLKKEINSNGDEVNNSNITNINEGLTYENAFEDEINKEGDKTFKIERDSVTRQILYTEDFIADNESEQELDPIKPVYYSPFKKRVNFLLDKRFNITVSEAQEHDKLLQEHKSSKQKTFEISLNLTDIISFSKFLSNRIIDLEDKLHKFALTENRQLGLQNIEELKSIASNCILPAIDVHESTLVYKIFNKATKKYEKDTIKFSGDSRISIKNTGPEKGFKISVRLSDITTACLELDKKIAKNKADIEQNKNNIQDNTNDINTLKQGLSNLAGQVSSNKKKNEEAINRLEENFNTVTNFTNHSTVSIDHNLLLQKTISNLKIEAYKYGRITQLYFSYTQSNIDYDNGDPICQLISILAPVSDFNETIYLKVNDTINFSNKRTVFNSIRIDTNGEVYLNSIFDSINSQDAINVNIAFNITYITKE